MKLMSPTKIFCYFIKEVTIEKFIKYDFTLFYKMKQKLSITIEKETIKLLDNVIKCGVFRNKSHAIEFSLKNQINSLSHSIFKEQEKVEDLNKTLKEKENE